LKEFNIGYNRIGGEFYVPAYMRCMFADIFTFAGELPKELGKLINLKELRLHNNRFQGKLYVPAYMGHCMFATLAFSLLQENCPRSSDNLPI